VLTAPSRNARLKHRIVTIDGRRFRVWELPPRAGFKACFRLTKLIGRALGELITGAGLALEDDNGDPLLDDFGKPMRLPLLAILSSADARRALARKVVGSLASANPEDAMQLADDLLVGHVEYDHLHTGIDAGFVPINDPETLDNEVPGIAGLLKLLQVSLELTGIPITADQPTVAGSSAESTERAAV
jgi:hypothetical protein